MSDGWDEIAAAEQRGEDARSNERKRCLALVRAAILEGKERGVPETSGTMRILLSIESAIVNGEGSP